MQANPYCLHYEIIVLVYPNQGFGYKSVMYYIYIMRSG